MEKIVEMSHAEGWTPYRNNDGDWVWQMPDDNSPHDLEWPGIKPPSPDCIPVWQDGGWYWSQPTKRALDGVHAERTMSVSCPHCNRQIEIVLLASPRQ